MSVSKNYMEAFDIFPCQLYDDVFMLFLLSALSLVARHAAHTTAHIIKKKLASQLTIPTIGNRPTSSSTQQHRRHNKLSLAKYRILIRLTGEYPSSQLKIKTSNIYQVSSQLLQLDTRQLARQLQIIIQLLGTLYTCLPSKRYFQLFDPCVCNYYCYQLS